MEAINSPNYIKIKNKIFVENKSLQKMLGNDAIVRNLTSGLAIIKKTNNSLLVGADQRRDGSVRGK